MVDLQRTREADHDVLTFTTEYGPLVAGDDIRWARSSFFDWLSGIQLMALRKAQGLSAREVGEVAEAGGPGVSGAGLPEPRVVTD